MAKKQYGLGHTRLTVPGRPDLTNKTAVVMVGDKTLEEALEECGGEILNEHIDATDQQRNTALANVSNQTANSTSGKMGYKVLDPTKTFAEQVIAENTIYEIRDVFDLNDVSVTLPAGSALKFSGGMVKNGALNGNYTSIIADCVKIFDDVVIGGDWNIIEAYAAWFGTNTSSIQEAVDSFPNRTINLNGEWMFDTTVTVPYDTSLTCDNAVCTADTNGTVFILYCSLLSQNLKNFVIRLTSNYYGTCIKIYGCAHSNVRGYHSTLEENIAKSEIYLPIIQGEPAWGSVDTNNDVVGVEINAVEANGDILYCKTITTYAYKIKTHVRIDATSGLNDSVLNISSWFCANSISQNDVGLHSCTVNLFHQASYKSRKLIVVDDYINKSINSDFNASTIYNIELMDSITIPSEYSSSFIDNGNCIYKSMLPGALMDLSGFFSKKRINRTSSNKQDNCNNLSTSIFPFATSLTFESSVLLNGIIGNAVTHLDAIKNVVNYINSLCLRRNVTFSIKHASFYNWNGGTSKFNLLINDSVSDIDILANYEFCMFDITFCYYGGANNQIYRTAIIHCENRTSNLKLDKIENFTYTDGEITAITPFNKTIRECQIQEYTPNTVPTLNSFAKGFQCIILGLPAIYNGTKFIDSDGYEALLRAGATTARPTLGTNTQRGFTFYDITLEKYIMWNGTAWVNLDGTALS